MVQAPPAKPGFKAADLIPALPGVIATLFAVWAVHRLTKGREREKAVLDLYKLVEEHAAKVSGAVITAWTTRAGPDRRRAVAEAKWRIQQLGATVERLRILSAKKSWGWRWPFRHNREVSVRVEMVELRSALTSDPFEIPNRRADRERSVEVEQEMGTFLTALDSKLADWIS